MAIVQAIPDIIPPIAGTAAGTPMRAMPRPPGSPAGHRMLSAPDAAVPRAADQPPLLDAPPAREAHVGVIEASVIEACIIGDEIGGDGIGCIGPGGLAPQAIMSAPDRRAARLAALRRSVPSLARMMVSGAEQHVPPPRTCGPDKGAWCLGTDEVDARLGPGGLDTGGIHEIKPALPEAGGCYAGAWSAAIAFLLRLIRRRLAVADTGGAGAVLWCAPRHDGSELGRLYAPGLAMLEVPPSRLLLVETTRREDTLWALEEGLGAGALALVVGIVDDVASTPARRLALRAERYRTPCLLLTSPRTPPAASTATRWRIARQPQAAHPFDPRAPGALRLAVALERCRQRPLLGEPETFCMEWSDEAHSFRMAPSLADRAACPRDVRLRRPGRAA